MNVRPFWWILLGALLMFVVLKIVTHISQPEGATTEKLKALVKTSQVANLVRTNEFRELIKTNEFKSFARTLAEDQLITLSKTLVG